MRSKSDVRTGKTARRDKEIHRGLRIKRHIEVSVHVAAPPEAVWAVVADVTRGGEWSGESLGCAWLGGASVAEVGVRFKGHNRQGKLRWDRLNEIITADRPHELAWRTIPTAKQPDSTDWRIRLRAEGSGTLVSQEMRVVRMSRLLEMFLAWLAPAHRDRTQGLSEDLQRLKTIVEAGQPPRESV